MAQHRHKRETPAHPPKSRVPRSVLVSAPLAVVATLSAVTMGVLAAEPATSDDSLLAASGTQSVSGASSSSSSSKALARRGDVVSRSTIRTAAKAESAARQEIEVDQQARRLAKKVDETMWTTDVLNLWSGPSEKSDKLGEIGATKQVAVTGRQQLGRTQGLYPTFPEERHADEVAEIAVD